ncbi:MAG TPA: ATP-binding protein [bacterium]|nr:ATP-binding protein [bacterium]
MNKIIQLFDNSPIYIYYISSKQFKILKKNHSLNVLENNNKLNDNLIKELKKNLANNNYQFLFETKQNNSNYYFNIFIKPNKKNLILIIVDETEKTKIKENFDLLDKKNKLLFWNSLDLILYLNPDDLSIIDINLSASHFFKNRRAQLQNKKITELLPIEKNNIFYDFINEIKKNGLNIISDIKLISSVNTVKYFNAFGMMMDLEKEISLYLNFRDITDYKNMQLKIIQNEKLISLGTLAAGIAHELSQPLAGINFFVKILNDELNKYSINSDSINEAITIINKEIKKADTIISSLKNLSRKPSFEVNEKMALNKTIQEALLLINKLFEKEEIKINLNLSENELYLPGNNNLMTQVITNLALNARDAMKNSKTKIIEIITENKEQKNYIIFRDTGTGFDETIINKIFEPFFTTKEVGEGVGLGLTICYDIIKSFNGNIYANNADSGGAQFTIELPIYK